MDKVAAAHWDLIAVAAKAVGVTPGNIKKWRQRRKVPPRWHRQIVEFTSGKVSFDMLEGKTELREAA